MITLLSAFAQMESESISQNIRIGLGYKVSRGEWSVAYSNFLGYDRTDSLSIFTPVLPLLCKESLSPIVW